MVSYYYQNASRLLQLACWQFLPSSATMHFYIYIYIYICTLLLEEVALQQTTLI